MELRPASGTPDASFGFTLPEDRMSKCSGETWAGVRELLFEIDKKNLNL